jgi:5-methylthioadenosine/S-adenosylhomocysteine deaminase
MAKRNAESRQAGNGSAAPQDCDLLIRNGYVITVDAKRRIFPSGAVAVAGGTILAVGPESEISKRFRSRHTLDAGGAPVHPGMIDAHYHATLHTTRGAVTDDPHAFADLGDEPHPYAKWFNELTDEDEYASSLLCCVEMARNGITAFMEAGTAFEPDTCATAAEEVGIRVSVTDPFLWDTHGGLSMTKQIARAPADRKRSMKALGKQLVRNRNNDSLVRGHVTIYGMGTASDELMLAAKHCADENGVVLSAHQSFDPSDAEFDDKRFGAHPLVHFRGIGALGPNVSLVHMNYLRDDEIDAIASSGASVVWHPGNYLFYGIAQAAPSRVPELLAKGVNFCFGTDAAKVWTFGDLPLVGYLVARAANAFIPVESILEMQTLGAAKAMGLDGMLGSLEAGKRADIVIRSADLAENQPGLNPIRETMLVSRSKSIDTVIVDGRIVVRHGRLTMADEAVAYAKARESARRLAARVGLTPGSIWETR